MKARSWTQASLMAAAAELERRDVDRYREAVLLVARRNDDIARRLEGLIADKTLHLQAILEWGANVDEAPIPDMSALLDFPIDPRLGDEDWADPALLSPYLVLAKATAANMRVFRFYSYVAAEAADPAVKSLAESFAREELARANKLREVRRLAWRQEDRQRARWHDLLGWFSDDVKAADVTAAIEAHAAAQIEKLAADAVTPPAEAKKLREAAHILRVSARPAPNLADDVAEIVFTPLTASSSVDRARQLCQRLFDISTMVAKHAPSEAIIRLAQKTAATLVSAFEKLGPAGPE
ncbi:MAG TPA: hypothetical protein VIF13_00025 [Hyphomicrobium sp.]|jgi:hypothetical protein